MGGGSFTFRLVFKVPPKIRGAFLLISIEKLEAYGL